MKNKLIYKIGLSKILLPFILAILFVYFSFYLLEKDEQINKEAKERYSGGGNIVTGYYLLFFLINLPGIIFMGLNAADNNVIIVSSLTYLIVSYLLIYIIHKRKNRKK